MKTYYNESCFLRQMMSQHKITDLSYTKYPDPTITMSVRQYQVVWPNEWWVNSDLLTTLKAGY